MSHKPKDKNHPTKRMFLVRRVVGKSMWPVLDPEQVIFAVRKRRYAEEDVVVIWHKGREKIKRVREISGSRYDVRGDNPSQSTDSRHFGLLKHEYILAKVIWPRV